MNRSLLRSAVLDHNHCEVLMRLLDGPLRPEDLSILELTLRAVITCESLRPTGALGPSLSDDDFYNPIFEELGILGSLPLDLSSPNATEERSLEESVEVILKDHFKRDLSLLELEEVRSLLPKAHPEAAKDPSFRLEDFDDPEDAKAQVLKMLMDSLFRHALEIMLLHRRGAIVFADSSIATLLHEYFFSRYPNELFADLDVNWRRQIRQLLGPSSSITVPPFIACILSRAKSRMSLPMTIIEMRDEYTASRARLWDHLEEMWCAPTLKKQMALLHKLQKSGESLFRAAFPERLPLVQTSFSVAAKLADLKPMSAIEELGKSIIGHEDLDSRVNGISFTRQLAGDLKRVSNVAQLLNRVLSNAERKRFEFGWASF